MTNTMGTMITGDSELADDPINPEWILSGDPRARAKTWAITPDRTTTHWTWDCSAGSFRWWFGVDETVHIVAGSVTVEVDGEAPMTLEVGDAAYFRAGQWSTWTVDDYVRKHAVLRIPVAKTLALPARVFGRRKYALK